MEKLYKNMEFLNLENEDLSVILLPDLGFKIASIKHKIKNFEFVFQPTDGKYEKAKYGDDFSKYDTSGIDDCIPSIDICLYPGTGINLVDHGDVWSLKWNVEPTYNGYVGKVTLPSIPLIFEKYISLEKSKIIIKYKIINNTDKNYMYLWAFHGLLNYEDSSYLEFPHELKNYINVQNDELWDFDITKISNFKENSTYKYYFTDKMSKGWASLVHPDKHLKFEINFNPIVIPYLGVWLTTGGFKGEKNIAIEPSNGFYDSLENAFDNEKYEKVMANSSNEWSLEINIKEV